MDILDPAFRLLHLQKPDWSETASLPDLSSSADDDLTSDVERPQASRPGSLYTKEEDEALIAHVQNLKKKNLKAKREETFRITSQTNFEKFAQLHPNRTWSQWTRRWYALRDQELLPRDHEEPAIISNVDPEATEIAPDEHEHSGALKCVQQDSPSRCSGSSELFTKSGHLKRTATEQPDQRVLGDGRGKKRRRIESGNPSNADKANNQGARVYMPHQLSPKRNDILRGIGPGLRQKVSRRAKSQASYEIKELSTTFRRNKRKAVVVETRRSKPAVTYNVRELVERTRFPSKVPSTTETMTTAKRKKLGVKQKQAEPPEKRRARDREHTAQRLQDFSNDVEKDPWETDNSGHGGTSNKASKANQGLINYILPILRKGGVSRPREHLHDEKYQAFLSLPRKRDIEYLKADSVWNLTRKQCHKADIASLLIQLTGDAAPGCCTNKCSKKLGLFKGCIVPSVHDRTYYGCANCIYRGTQSMCSLKGSSRRNARAVSQTPSAPSRHTTAPTGPDGSVLKTAVRKHAATKDKTALEEETASKDIVSASLQQVQTSGLATRPKQQGQQESAAQLAVAPANKSHPGPRPSEMLSMEMWEKAPGRIRSQTNNLGIAFSKSYLASGAEVALSSETTFKVEIIHSGHTHSFKAEADLLRVCSIATAGKLTVRIDGEQPLVIGSHGMFCLRPGSACLVDSEIYEDVVLHITSVKAG